MAHPLSRTDVRLGLAVVAMVGVVGTGAFMLGGSETGRSFGRGLAIAVVPPVEREVLPGETMEVGALNDGFDRAALERKAEPSIYDGYLPPDAYIGEERTPRMPMPTPVTPQTPMQAYQQVVDQARIERPAADPLADGSSAFGFDQPRPDYAAERALRWGRMETAVPQSADVTPANEGGDSPQYSPE